LHIEASQTFKVWAHSSIPGDTLGMTKGFVTKTVRGQMPIKVDDDIWASSHRKVIEKGK